MTLMYWREYWFQFYIAQAYGVSEATVSYMLTARYQTKSPNIIH